ncbi:hypothetical protein DL95DRAFT_399605 [Leptodontidium sp. 2 PMI_412]|nr:hypothetical protein DL95DRAFT_399605 [Leptodontidium sp. 2 PMI_412]
MSDNHWSIYLLLSKGAEAWDTKGILDCSTHTYTQTNSCIEYWDYLVPGISIGQICTLLWNKERDSYEMSGGGSGCRYWVYVIIWLLEDNKYLSSGSTNDLYPNLLFRYSKSGEKRDLPMVEGSFYESGRFTMPTPATGSSAATGSSSAATTSAGGASGSSETEQPYYFTSK